MWQGAAPISPSAIAEVLERWKVPILGAAIIAAVSLLTHRYLFFPGAMVIPMLGVMLVVLFTLWRPIVGMAIYFVVYPNVAASSEIGMMKVLSLLLTLFLLGIWLWGKIRNRNSDWHREEYKWLYYFLIYVCLSLLPCLISGFTIMDWARDIAPLLNLLLVPIMAEYFRDNKNRWLVYLVFISAGIGVFQYVSGLLSLYGLRLPYFPYGSIVFHPSWIFVLGISMVINKEKYRYLWLLVAAIGLGIALLSPTRTIWLTVLMTIPVLMMLFSRHIIKAVIILIIMLVSLVYMLYRSDILNEYTKKQGERFTILMEYQSDKSTLTRFDEIKQAAELFARSPVFGVGYGYQYYFWEHYVSMYQRSGYIETNFTHNDIMNVLAKGGLVGLVLFYLMLLGFLKNLKRRKMEGDDTKRPIWATIAMIVLFASLIMGLSTPVFQSRIWMLGLSIILALGFGYDPSRKPGDHSASRAGP